MRALTIFLSVLTILLLTTCNEEGPTSSSGVNQLRRINVYDINNNSIINTIDHYRTMFDIKFRGDSAIAYSLQFGDSEGGGATSFGTKLVVNDFKSYSNGFQYFTTEHVGNFNIYPDINSIFFSTYNDVYRINGNGDVIIRLTNGNYAWVANPLFSSQRFTLVYGSTNFDICAIFRLNTNTNELDTLVIAPEAVSVISPLFFDEDSNRLIYWEWTDPYMRGWIKSVNLIDKQDIKIVAEHIPWTTIGKHKSNDDKIVFMDDEKIYTLDLNSSEIKFITAGISADISNDGDKIVFTMPYELFLINTDGSNLQKLVSRIAERKYLYLPSFSPDNERIVFMESRLRYDRQ